MTAYENDERTPPASTPVLIAGGGPVGLATAMELAHHHVPCVVIEPRAQVSWLRPRAKTTSARTMEHFRRWGLADTLRRRAPLPVAWSDQAVFCTSLTGREITRFDQCFGLELTGSELTAEAGQQVPQPVVESVLREAAAAAESIRLVTGMRVTAVSEDSDAVRVQATDHDGRTRRIDARYVVGCEGGRSLVRDAIGARYEGSGTSRPNLSIVFRAPGLAALVPHGPAVHYWVINQDQPGLVGRLDLEETWWAIAQGVDVSAGPVDPTPLVHKLLGAQPPVSILSTDAWQARMLLADRYASRRMFLAGDSAHQNPPWGGHGFNTGIGDAVNIGWKLAAVINGWAPETLLASYEQERRPIAALTIQEAARNMATLAPELADPGLSGTDAEFDRARPAVAAAIHATKDGEFHSLPLTLGYDYRSSALVADEPDPQTPEPGPGYRPSAAPGHRLPHRWLRPGDSLYDHLGPELTLLGDPSAPAHRALTEAARARGVPLSTVELTGAHWREVFGAALVLVRPDQHVAWRGHETADPDAVIRRAVGHTPQPAVSA